MTLIHIRQYSRCTPSHVEPGPTWVHVANVENVLKESDATHFLDLPYSSHETRKNCVQAGARKEASSEHMSSVSKRPAEWQIRQSSPYDRRDAIIQGLSSKLFHPIKYELSSDSTIPRSPTRRAPTDKPSTDGLASSRLLAIAADSVWG